MILMITVDVRQKPFGVSRKKPSGRQFFTDRVENNALSLGVIEGERETIWETWNDDGNNWERERGEIHYLALHDDDVHTAGRGSSRCTSPWWLAYILIPPEGERREDERVMGRTAWNAREKDSFSPFSSFQMTWGFFNQKISSPENKIKLAEKAWRRKGERNTVCLIFPLEKSFLF